MIVSTCGTSTNFDTVVAVYRGSCASLSCVTFNDDDGSCATPVASTLSFSSQAGVEYKILVYGYSSYETGAFELVVFTPSPTPIPTPSPISLPTIGGSNSNGACNLAVPLSIASTCAGSTSGAPSVTGSAIGSCLLHQSPGVWYSIVGNGAFITVSTCGSGTVFDTILAVYAGSCGSLSCVAVNDDDQSCENFASTVSWWSQAGVEYKILVYGFGDASGAFDIVISSSLNYIGECSFANRCGVCQGDCDEHWDCETGLKCYQRTGTEAVPGCSDGGVYNYDYCYRDTSLPPEPPSQGPALWVNSAATDCLPWNPCGVCQGDCDVDSDCQPGLYCHQRDAYEPVPGCSGWGIYATDHCIPR